MLIDLRSLHKGEVNELVLESSIKLDVDLSGMVDIYDVDFIARISKSGDTFMLDLSYRADAVYSCDRCLDDTAVVFEDRIERQISFSEEIEDAIILESRELDIKDVIEKEIIVNTPTQVLCSEDCKGLCFNCGVNLNKETCGCNEDKINPRFEALKNLVISDKEV